MGLNWHALQLLCEAKNSGVVFDQTATIGRQSCHVSSPSILRFLAEYKIDAPAGLIELTRNPEYVDPVFKCLGATRIDSIDNSDYESATKVWDMNQSIPEDWHEQYDFAYDGGSIEHIFNIPQAFKNYMNLVRVGGHLMIVTMANNYFGHGFYQFSPELFYRVLSPPNGFVVERLITYEDYGHAPVYEVPDPATIRSRIELSNSWVGVGLIVLARREARTIPFERWPQQSDYSSVWTAFDESKADPGTSPPSAPSLRRHLIDKLKRSLPRLVEFKHKIYYDYPALPRIFGRWRARNDHKRRSLAAQPDRFQSNRRKGSGSEPAGRK
jgi:hypothetical protein